MKALVSAKLAHLESQLAYLRKHTKHRRPFWITRSRGILIYYPVGTLRPTTVSRVVARSTCPSIVQEATLPLFDVK